MLKRLCVFCGSSFGVRPEYAEAARAVGRLLAERNVELVYGGSNAGTMHELANACMGAGGRVIGIMPRHMVDREIAHRGITELHIVNSMHERKAMMADLASAFLALPGGFGTFEEFFEVLTWSQLGLHRKACGVLNVAGYYDPLLALADHGVAEGFVRPVHRELILSGTEPAELLDHLGTYVPPVVEKWLDRSSR